MLCKLCIPIIISQAMLKLTHSFSRFTKLNININTTLVKKYSHLSCGRKTCVTLYGQYSIADTLTHICQQVRQLASIKKSLRLRRTQNSSSTNAAPTSREMNNRLLPSVAYISHGGDYEPQDESAMDWEPGYPSSSTTHPINRRKDKIPADFRKWEHVCKKADGNPFRFKVVSYNVLAQYLLDCHPYLYTGCDPQDLQWDLRFERIFKEITDLDPDIMCLQEVQSTHLKHFYVRFERIGYYGIFKQKTGHREDGCAIYFKKDVFEMDSSISVEYYQPEMPILNRDNVGLIMKLVPIRSRTTPIVVATTHLLYNPNRSDVRLAQLQVLLAEIDRFAYYEDDARNPCYHPIVLTGDFNSTPESAVVKLLDTGKVSTIAHRDRSDWRRIGVTDSCQHLSVIINRPRGVPSDYSMIKLHNSEMGMCPSDVEGARCDRETLRHSLLFNTPLLHHPLKLASVYLRTKRNNNEEATTYQDYWITVDYMYFSCCNKLKLLERLRLPTRLECEVLGRLPNDVYGSDHLMLAAHFEIRSHPIAH